MNQNARIVDKKELRNLILFSPSHVRRLEKRGEFPSRIPLGPCRVGWLLSEVLEWRDCKRDGRPWKSTRGVG